MRKFLIKVGDSLQVGERNEAGEIIGQAAIVTFSEDANERINLKESDTPGAFTQAVQRMPGPEPGGRTKTHKAMALVEEEILVKKNGYRENQDDVAKILVVITDGEQTKDSKSPYVGEAIQPFFKKNMEVFAIGVGLQKESARKEIRDMVQQPENAIFKDSYTDLIDSAQEFIRRFCPGIIDTSRGIKIPKHNCLLTYSELSFHLL